ncbi:S-adenosyl-L-methionine-dependent methyltransferase [Tricladium varicosporioides]|nr:S-adenosyl-L-methionine-dependent methyltransferase [Hymenoscyphus varicosporioides]
MSKSSESHLISEWDAHFTRAATTYEKQSAGVTRRISQQLLALLPPITKESIVHDNACGPGIVSLDIFAGEEKPEAGTPTIFATDFNAAMVKEFQRIVDEKSLKGVQVQVMDGSDLSAFEDGKFTHSITNFGMFAFPDPVKGAAHIHRTLKPGGVAAITVWKYPGNIYFINEILQDIHPGLDEWFPIRHWTEESHLRDVLEKGGFKKENIEITVLKTIWSIENLDEVVELFSGSFFDHAKGGLSNEEKASWSDVVRKKMIERNGKGIEMIAWAAVAKK